MTIQDYIVANATAKATVVTANIISIDPDIAPFESSIYTVVYNGLVDAMTDEASWIKGQIVNDRYRQFPHDKEGNKGYFQAIADRDKKLKELGLYFL